ncbi:MAG: hypothetical protein RI908_978, partial [Actinomycetota bacterium]
MRVREQVEHDKIVEFIARLREKSRVTRARSGVTTDEHDDGCSGGGQHRDSRRAEAGTCGIRDDKTRRKRVPVLEQRFDDRCPMGTEVVPSIAYRVRIRLDQSDGHVRGHDRCGEETNPAIRVDDLTECSAESFRPRDPKNRVDEHLRGVHTRLEERAHRHDDVGVSDRLDEARRVTDNVDVVEAMHIGFIAVNERADNTRGRTATQRHFRASSPAGGERTDCGLQQRMRDETCVDGDDPVGRTFAETRPSVRIERETYGRAVSNAGDVRTCRCTGDKVLGDGYPR